MQEGYESSGQSNFEDNKNQFRAYSIRTVETEAEISCRIKKQKNPKNTG